MSPAFPRFLLSAGLQLDSDNVHVTVVLGASRSVWCVPKTGGDAVGVVLRRS